jgi:hypothetical protein
MTSKGSSAHEQADARASDPAAGSGGTLSITPPPTEPTASAPAAAGPTAGGSVAPNTSTASASGAGGSCSHDSEQEYVSQEAASEEEDDVEGDVVETGAGRGGWQGSRTTQEEIDWLKASRRIPLGV